MTPTILFRDGKPFLVTGSPGGSRIITTVLQIILNVIDHQMNIAEATVVPRFHHQWRPDILWMEPGFSNDTVKLLRSRGHKIKLSSWMGKTQSIILENDQLFGASDPRGSGALTFGY